jgi:hypothetical protein
MLLTLFKKKNDFIFLINEKLEKCTGFFLFDNNGVRIDAINYGDDNVCEDKTNNKDNFIFNGIILAILIIIIITGMGMYGRVLKLERENEILKQDIQGMEIFISSKWMEMREMYRNDEPPKPQQSNEPKTQNGGNE